MIAGLMDGESRMDGWVCSKCGYSLVGLERRGEVACPECGRRTSEEEQREMARRRQMPRQLGRIARLGFVLTLIVAAWGLVGMLSRPDMMPLYSLVTVICVLSMPMALVIWRRLEEIHRRNEILAWIAAHATWAAPLVGIGIINFV